MEFTKEFIEKVQAAKSAEELLEMAKAENMEMTAEESVQMFDALHKTVELSDEELDNVAGGADSQSEYYHKFNKGERVKVMYNGEYIYEGVIKSHRKSRFDGTIFYTLDNDRFASVPESALRKA